MRTTGRAGWLVAAPLLVVLWLALAPTALGGGTTYVITHGISMKPRFSSGDLAVRKHTDTVHLHLPSLQARADAAGEVIGAEPGKSLSVDDATTVQQATTAPRSVGLGPVRLPVGPARKLALGLLLAGLAVGFGTLALMRRETPLSEREVLLRRHASLLVPVARLADPAGRVVDVADLATLVRLATPYELLILHATTPDGDVFVLPDGDTTYRFRDVPADDEAGDDVPADDEAADDDLTAAAQALATRLRAAQPEGEPAAEAVIPQPRRPETAPAD